MTTLNVPIQLRGGNEVDCPIHMLAREVYVCLDSGKIFAGTGPSTPVMQLGGSAAIWGGITGTLANQTDLEAVLTALMSSIASEASTRASADTTNATAISTEASRATTAEGLLVPKTTTVNGHALSSNVVVSASDLTTGTLPHAQLPTITESDITNLVTDLAGKQATLTGTGLARQSGACTELSGDVTTSGSNATTMKNTGTAGTYTKVTTDAQGRVSSGTTLSAGDVPDISATYEVKTNKDAASGYAGLDSGSKLKSAELPTDATGTMGLSELDVTTIKINATNKDIILSRSAACSLAVTGSPNFTGSIQTTQLGNVAACTVTTNAAGGATQWFYTVVAKDAIGNSSIAASPTTTISNGPVTLDGSHFNTITWNAVTGAVTYDVIRTKTGGTPTTVGVIGTVAADAALTFNDTGQAGDGEQYPAQNLSGSYSDAIANQAGLAYFWGGYGPVMPIVAGSNAALGNTNKVQLALFYLPFDMLLNKLTVFVNAVSASANQFADFGLADLNSNLLAHGQINVSSGQATGARQATISGSVTVRKGFIWLVWTTNSTDATFAVTVAVANSGNTIMNKTNSPFPRNGTGATTASGALPTKASATGLGIGAGYPNRTITAASLTLPYVLFE